jgi:hypothetical protein
MWENVGNSLDFLKNLGEIIESMILLESLLSSVNVSFYAMVLRKTAQKTPRTFRFLGPLG